MVNDSRCQPGCIFCRHNWIIERMKSVYFVDVGYILLLAVLIHNVLVTETHKQMLKFSETKRFSLVKRKTQ
jgi:hypothetical protein